MENFYVTSNVHDDKLEIFLFCFLLSYIVVISKKLGSLFVVAFVFINYEETMMTRDLVELQARFSSST